MNRAIVKLFSSSSRIIPRIYASTKPTTAATATGHHGSGEVHHHDDHGHDHDHHHHHHEPELRKTQDWRHHSGIQSKYENQGEDPSISFMQGKENLGDVSSSNIELYQICTGSAVYAALFFAVGMTKSDFLIDLKMILKV
jgi:hypothetical protein